MTATTYSTKDIVDSVLEHCGEVTDGTSYYQKRALEYVNRAHVAILSGGNEFDVELSKPWSWAVNRFAVPILLYPKYHSSMGAGGVNVTQFSNLITFTTPPPMSLANCKIKIDERPDYMRIVTHVANSPNAYLDGPYASYSGANLGFGAHFLDYKLSDPSGNGILRLVQAMNIYQPQDLQGDEEYCMYYCDENEMNRDYPLELLLNGAPTFFCITSKDQSGNIYIRVNKTVNQHTRVEYKFISIPSPLEYSCNNFPLVPVEHRDCLDFAACYYLLQDKNDDRKTMYFQLAQQKIKGMQKAEEKQKTQASKMRGKLVPRLDNWQRSKKFVTQETS